MTPAGCNSEDGRTAKRPVTLRRLALLVVVIGLVGFLSLVGWGAASLRAFVVPTGSMAPAVRPGDRIAADIDPKSPPKRGEIWVVHMPRMPAKSLAVKRVIGLPGETIEVKAGQVWIDGRPLEEPYLTGKTAGVMPAVTLGPDQYFLMGDNRAVAFDCRAWGPLESYDLRGKVTYRFWPPHRLGGP
jgi:signal peptidase I